jgi:ATP-dependent exoDNAse (exonuclease V) beta subunit
VVDLVSYLRTLANPRDEEALYAVLGSPLLGVSPDALVLLAAAARRDGRDPWWVLQEPRGILDAISDDDRRLLERFIHWIAGERARAAREGVEELLERALLQTGYDLAVLAMPGGQRRLANVRKLMRLGRQHLAEHGPDLRGFLDLVRARAESWRPDPDQSEAPVESEALDAVRLMTIHRAKGLEFEIVCVADLGRGARWGAELLRVGRDGRIGLRLARPGTGARVQALAYDELGEERRAAEAREERRLFYVAMTRARERLILSGAAKLDAWGEPGAAGAPITWLGPALVPSLDAGGGVHEGVRFAVVQPQDVDDRVGPQDVVDRPRAGEQPVAEPPPVPPAPPRPVSSLSYTSLAAYQRCGYRFYVERVLGVPGSEPRGSADEGRAAAVLTAAERGTVVHTLLERLDFRRPVVPGEAAILAASPRPPSAAELEEIGALIRRFTASELCARLGQTRRVRREQRFGFPFDGVLITGMLDVIAGEAGGGALIVDYKTDRLAGSSPEAVLAGSYAIQRLVYALAALRSGAERVEVVHVFLEAPDELVAATFGHEEVPGLERQLAAMTEGIARRSFAVTEVPRRDLCAGCPAEGGLCSWPLAMTRREAPDRLF